MSQPVFLRNATGLVKSISAWRAFVFNIMYITPSGVFWFLVIGQGLFPGGNLIIASLLTLIPSLIVAFMYAQFSAAMPRSGGDYVFASRILHPSIGFMINFVVVIVNISVIGVGSIWITSFGLGPMFSGLAAIWHQQGLSSLATTVTTPTGEFIIGALAVIILPSLIFFGNDVTFRIFNVLFAIAMFSIIVFVAVMISTPTSVFVANFNSLSSTSYNATISAARNAGANLSFSNTDTLLLMIYTILAVWGFTFSQYMGGEVKNAQRSQVISIIGSCIFYILVICVPVSLVAYLSMGHNFLAALNFLALNNNPAYTLPASLPTLAFLAGYATKNGWILIIEGLGIIAGAIATIGIADPFFIIRCLFAWSFDRLIPAKFADVHEKYRVPHYSLAAIIVIGVFFAWMAVYTPLSLYITYNITASFIIVAIVGVAAIVFPWKRKDLFTQAPKVTTARIGKVPIISIVGVACVIVGILVAYASLLPAISGPFNPIYIGLTAVFFIVGFVIFWISYLARKRSGIPLNMIFKEIPPE